MQPFKQFTMQRTEIKNKIREKDWTLVIYKETVDFLPKEKFVRKNDKILNRKQITLAEYPIDIPYEIETKIVETSRLASHYFQTDDMYYTTSQEVKRKICNNNKLNLFIKEKMKLHTK